MMMVDEEDDNGCVTPGGVLDVVVDMILIAATVAARHGVIAMVTATGHMKLLGWVIVIGCRLWMC